jgi:hypothetical protein
MKHSVYRQRRGVIAVLVLIGAIVAIIQSPDLWQTYSTQPASEVSTSNTAIEALRLLEVKGRAPKTGYSRSQFGDGWATVGVCDMRNIILHRDMTQVEVNDGCKVAKGQLADPYTGTVVTFIRGPTTSDKVQIDHVVALSNAWQTGAQQLSFSQREALANDPLELLAVDGAANQQKSDGDAATWLPSNKPFRCQYIARQIAVKKKYALWVTKPEYDAMENILNTCPGQTLPSPVSP